MESPDRERSTSHVDRDPLIAALLERIRGIRGHVVRLRFDHALRARRLADDPVRKAALEVSWPEEAQAIARNPCVNRRLADHKALRQPDSTGGGARTRK